MGSLFEYSLFCLLNPSFSFVEIDSFLIDSNDIDKQSTKLSSTDANETLTCWDLLN